LLALGLAVADWFMAGDDLALLRLGRVDPAGEDDTRQARGEVVFAALLPPLAWAVIALLIWSGSLVDPG
jgi:hypothetical protein